MVDVGFVEGMMAAITPIGLATSKILLLLVFFNNPDGLHRADCPINIVGAEQVFERLVFDGSVARLFYSKLREPLRMRDAGLRDFQKYAFNLLLRKIFKLMPGIPARFEAGYELLEQIRDLYPSRLSGSAFARLAVRAGPMTNEFFSFVERTRNNVNGD